MGLIESRILVYIGNGSAWLAYGVLSLFDNIMCEILASLFLSLGIVSILMGMSSKEKDDEMSEYNMMKAKAVAMDLLKIIILLVLVFDSIIGLLHSIFPSLNETIFISIKAVLPMIIGVLEIMVGCLFLKYQKDGE